MKSSKINQVQINLNSDQIVKIYQSEDKLTEIDQKNLIRDQELEILRK